MLSVIQAFSDPGLSERHVAQLSNQRRDFSRHSSFRIDHLATNHITTLRRFSSFAAAAVHAFVLALDEAQQVIDLRHQLAVAAKDFPSIVQSDFGAVDQFMGFGQGLDDLRREIVAFQVPRH